MILTSGVFLRKLFRIQKRNFFLYNICASFTVLSVKKKNRRIAGYFSSLPFLIYIFDKRLSHKYIRRVQLWRNCIVQSSCARWMALARKCAEIVLGHLNLRRLASPFGQVRGLYWMMITKQKTGKWLKVKRTQREWLISLVDCQSGNTQNKCLAIHCYISHWHNFKINISEKILLFESIRQ